MLAARGARDMDDGAAPVRNDADASELRSMGLRVHLLTLVSSVIVTVLFWIVATLL